MKTIVGIDYEGHYEAALRMLSRLRLADNHVELLHADEPTATYAFPTYVPLSVDANYRQLAQDLLDRAQDRACDLGLRVSDTRYVIDPPAQALIDESIVQHEDLIAIGTRKKTKYGSLFLGSVGRALTIRSRASVLVAKEEVAATGPLTLVVATDHSTYADDAIRMLVRLRPQGIRRLVVVTAIPSPTHGDTNRELRTTTSHASHSMVDHLKSFGIPAEYRVIEGTPEDVIDVTMSEVKGDLVVMGAQGHGFLERMMMGSISLHQVVGTPHSVLVLRPR